MDWTSFLAGVLIGAVSFGAVSFVVGCMLGIQCGKACTMQQMVQAISAKTVDRLVPGQFVSCEWTVGLSNAGGDDFDGDDETEPSPQPINRVFNN